MRKNKLKRQAHFEEVRVISIGESRFRVLSTPGLVFGIARDDEINYLAQAGTFNLEKRGGRVAGGQRGFHAGYKMIIDNPGPPIGLEDIAALESELDAELPDTHRNFLLLYNGGTPTPDTIDVMGWPDSPTDLQVFFGIGRSVESSDLYWNLNLIAERCPGRGVVPIACDSGGNLFCLKIERGHAREVVYCDLEAGGTLYGVAQSFGEFVERIRCFDQ